MRELLNSALEKTKKLEVWINGNWIGNLTANSNAKESTGGDPVEQPKGALTIDTIMDQLPQPVPGETDNCNMVCFTKGGFGPRHIRESPIHFVG